MLLIDQCGIQFSPPNNSDDLCLLFFLFLLLCFNPSVPGPGWSDQREKDCGVGPGDQTAVAVQAVSSCLKLPKAASAFIYGDLTNEKRIVEWVLETRQVLLPQAASAFIYGYLTNEKRIVEWVLETRQL